MVQKEMYTFEDQGGRTLALRPEGTAGINRAVIENGLINEALQRADGVKNQAAELLGIKRTTLIEKLKKKGV